MMTPDHDFLLRAVALSKTGMETGTGGLPFGAVIVRDGVIVAEGWNEVASTNDPTAHAEVTVIRRACQAVGSFSLEDTTIYSSCEPCPMCLSAIYWSRIGRLVYANTREEAAAVGFSDALIYEEVAKAPSARRLPSDHLPLLEASAVFAAWDDKADKLDY
jgi:guanine deaminase